MRRNHMSVVAIMLLVILGHAPAGLTQEQPSSLVGIGVKLAQARHGALIEAVLPGGPAEKAGLLADEVIIAVDGISITSVQQAVEKIVGPEGSTVALHVVDAEGRIRPVQIIRGPIQLGARGTEDFAGLFVSQQDPQIQIVITHLEMNRFYLGCEAEHWKGFGLLYLNSHSNTYHMKGIFQIGVNQDVPEQLQEVVGYFRIDCISSGMLQLKRAWNLAGEPGDATNSVMFIRSKADQDDQSSAEQRQEQVEPNAP
ncbi:MAG: PDZ domain-containing protein [Phycisphaeraceae bacterium]|nr:PDZ domain-containing protein [Phycisphaeraceae bacterium]